MDIVGKRERITYLELLRGILIIAVVAIHTTSFSVTKLTTGSTLYPLYYIVNVGCNFAVPGFLFLSALLLFYHYDGRQLSWLSFYKKRIKKVVVPYLFWSFFYAAYYTYAHGLPLEQGWHRLWSNLPLGNNYEHLYFMIIIAQFYLLFPLFMLLQKIPVLKRHPLVFGIAVQLAIYLLNYYVWHMDEIGTFIGSYMLYLYLGAYAAKKMREKGVRQAFGSGAGWMAAAFIAAAAVYIGQKWLQTAAPHWVPQPYLSYMNKLSEGLYFSLACLFLLQLARKFRQGSPLYKTLFSLGAYSYGIYLLHPFFLLLWREYVQQTGPFTYHLLVWAGGALSILLSWAIVKAVSRTPLAPYIVGESAK